MNNFKELLEQELNESPKPKKQKFTDQINKDAFELGKKEKKMGKPITLVSKELSKILKLGGDEREKPLKLSWKKGWSSI